MKDKKDPFSLSDAEKKRQIEDMWNKFENESHDDDLDFTYLIDEEED